MLIYTNTSIFIRCTVYQETKARYAIKFSFPDIDAHSHMYMPTAWISQMQQHLTLKEVKRVEAKDLKSCITQFCFRLRCISTEKQNVIVMQRYSNRQKSIV